MAALYHFTDVAEPAALQAELREFCASAGICGTLILAPEGINGTVAGTQAAVSRLIDHLRRVPGCADMDVKYSRAVTQPFGKMKVKVKPEIVTLGMDGVDPVHNAGVYVEPKDWNALIADPHTILIDTRNDYEVALGTFAGAINPETRSFRQFPGWFEQMREQWENEGDSARPRKIAMFCTGGIRCEKSTAMARAMGCEEVYHLKGGILKYLEEISPEESLWQGNCFVFDERVSVTHGLALTDDVICQKCGHAHAAGDDHICTGDMRWGHRSAR